MKTYDPNTNGSHITVPTPWGDAHGVTENGDAVEVYAPDGSLAGFAYAYMRDGNTIWCAKTANGTSLNEQMGSVTVAIYIIARRAQPVQRELYVQVRDGAEGDVIHETRIVVLDRGLADDGTKRLMAMEAVQEAASRF